MKERRRGNESTCTEGPELDLTAPETNTRFDDLEHCVLLQLVGKQYPLKVV